MRADYAHFVNAITILPSVNAWQMNVVGGIKMRHCTQFKADEVYYLEENSIYTDRILSIGFCPICKRPVAELVEHNCSGGINKVTLSGIHAQNLMKKVQSEIVYAGSDANYRKLKGKPFGWKYGLNKEFRNGKIRQYAKDFYGNKELIKEL